MLKNEAHTMGVSGTLRFDPWRSDFGPSLVNLDALGEESAEVEYGVEIDPGKWTAIPCSSGDTVLRVALVDGVRRIENFLRWEDEATSVPLLLGSLAAGAICLELGRPANLRDALHTPFVSRLLCYFAKDVAAGVLPKELPLPGIYELIGVTKPNADLTLELQQRMRQREGEIAMALHAQGHELVLADGPLHNMLAFSGSGVVGYVKSHHRMLLKDSQIPLLVKLAPGERTPIMRLTNSNDNSGYERLTWYLRLGPPMPGETALAGIVRLEVLADLGLEVAQRKAAETASLLPRLVSGRHRDARSPQNLAPIAALEKELRRRMGSPELVTRLLRQTFLAKVGK